MPDYIADPHIKKLSVQILYDANNQPESQLRQSKWAVDDRMNEEL